jgi:hypothetical protein
MGRRLGAMGGAPTGTTVDAQHAGAADGHEKRWSRGARPALGARASSSMGEAESSAVRWSRDGGHQ